MMVEFLNLNPTLSQVVLQKQDESLSNPQSLARIATHREPGRQEQGRRA